MKHAFYELPYPPSVNHSYCTNGKSFFLSKKAKRYKDDVPLIIKESENVYFGDSPLSVSIDLYPPDRRSRDIDNVLKMILDVLQSAGIFNNDRQITQLRICKREFVEGGKIFVYIDEDEFGERSGKSFYYQKDF